MKRLPFLLYGALACLALLASLGWAVGFIGGIGVPVLDSQPPSFPPLSGAVAAIGPLWWVAASWASGRTPQDPWVGARVGPGRT